MRVESTTEPARPRAAAEYRERSPLDLIDEDKRPFARRRILATYLGGLRTTYDETSEEAIPPLLYVGQALIYLFCPILFGVLGIAVPDRYTASLVAAGVAAIVLDLLVFCSYFRKGNNIERETPSKFKFLFTPRSSIYDLLFDMLLVPIYAFLMTYMVHVDTCPSTGWRVGTVIVVVFQSYCLASHPIPESTPYNTNDSFSLTSHHY